MLPQIPHAPEFPAPEPAAVDLSSESVAGEEDPGASLDLPVNPQPPRVLEREPDGLTAIATATSDNICPDCKGRGQVGGQSCSRCDGTGRVLLSVGPR